MLRPNQRLTGTGMVASMAPGLPLAISAQLLRKEDFAKYLFCRCHYRLWVAVKRCCALTNAAI
jgi:hypothetical protein